MLWGALYKDQLADLLVEVVCLPLLEGYLSAVSSWRAAGGSLQGAQGGGAAHLHQRPVLQVSGEGRDTAVWTSIPQLLPEGTSKGDPIRSQHAERSNKLLHAA